MLKCIFALFIVFIYKLMDSILNKTLKKFNRTRKRERKRGDKIGKM